MTTTPTMVDAHDTLDTRMDIDSERDAEQDEARGRELAAWSGLDDNQAASPTELRRARMAWLINLRWWAISAGLGGAVLASVLDWRFVATPAVIGGALVLAAINTILALRVRREVAVGANELLVHAAMDMLVLTWMISWSGGINNPLVSAYSFHVVLGALIAGAVGVVFAVVASASCLSTLIILQLAHRLPNGVLIEVPTGLQVVATVMLLLGLGYLALKIAAQTRAQRMSAQEQGAAAQGTLQLLLDALDALRVGVEASDVHGQRLIENEGAKALERNDATQAALSRARVALDEGKTTVTERFAVRIDDTDRLIELVALSARHPRIASAVLMVDRTETMVVERRTVLLERLATLGRAMQGVAHELNTPLTTMRTLAKDLRAALQQAALTPAERDDVEQSLDLLIEEAQRCRTLTQSLLQTASDGTRSRGQQRLPDVMRRAMRVVAADEQAVSWNADELAAVGLVDADTFLQVFMNLLQNALAATSELHHDGQGPCVFVRAERKDDRAVVRILDRGPGLPALVQARLFEPFVTTKTDGTGLGLYTCLQLIEALHGTLTIANRDDGPGVVATITLAPIAPV